MASPAAMPAADVPPPTIEGDRRPSGGSSSGGSDVTPEPRLARIATLPQRQAGQRRRARPLPGAAACLRVFRW